MKTSLLSVLLDIGAVAFRRLPPCLLAVSAFLLTTAQAQEKPAESAHAAGWVVIPVEEYRVLRAKAYPVEHDPEPPPLDATLTRVDYDLHVTGELAAGRANLTVDVLKDGWVRVPVPAGLLVREARLDGKLVSLVPAPQGKGAGHLSALLSHPGRWVLALDVDVPVGCRTGPCAGNPLSRFLAVTLRPAFGEHRSPQELRRREEEPRSHPVAHRR